jgi:hypothetical protein
LSGRAERAKADRGDDATTNKERHEKLRPNTDAAIVFGCGGLHRGNVLVGSNDHGASGKKLAGKPIEVRRYLASRGRLHACRGCRAQNVLLVSLDDLGKGAAVEAEKFQELRQCGFDFRDDLVKGNVGKTGRKIGKQAFKCQEFLQRWF